MVSRYGLPQRNILTLCLFVGSVFRIGIPQPVTFYYIGNMKKKLPLPKTFTIPINP